MSVFWIPALSVETFERAIQEIAGRLGLKLASETKEDVKVLVKRHLSKPSAGKWLLILDNADDQHIVRKLLDYLPMSSSGLTIITARTMEVAQNLSGGNIIELRKLPHDDAVHLLKRALIRKDVVHDARLVTDLLEEFDYFPLAITQAAAYMNINANTTLREYLRLLRSTDEDMTYLLRAEIRDNTRYTQSSNAVATTWIVSFNQISEQHSDAAELLEFISCIEWKGIPYSILPFVLPEARMHRAIGTLCSYSFLSKQPDKQVYDMPRLVHVASRIWLERKARISSIRAQAVKHLTAIVPFTGNYQSDRNARELWREYMPHVAQFRRVSTINERIAKREHWGRLCFRVGQYLLLDGRTKASIEWLREACDLRSQLTENDSDRLASQHELARAYLDNGQVQDAIPLLEQVVAIKDKSIAARPSRRLGSHHMLAGAYSADGRTKDAIRVLLRIILIEKNSPGSDRASRLGTQHTLARIYMASGQTQDAIQLLERVVANEKKTLNADHPDLLASQHALAKAYLRCGQIQPAIRLLEEIVAIEGTVAESQPSRLASQHELARAYLDCGRTRDAIRLLEQIDSIEKKFVDENHPSRLDSKSVLARAYLKDGQTDKAIELFRHVVDVEKSLAADHPDRLASQLELAEAYQKNGQTKEAIRMFEDIVAVTHSLAKDHPTRLASQHVLARAYLDNGQISRAVRLLEHVVAMKASLAKDHQGRLASQYTLSRAYYAAGRVADAYGVITEVVAIEETSLAKNDPSRLQSLDLMKTIHDTIKRRDTNRTPR